MYSIQTGNISCLVWFLWSMESIETFCCQRARLLFKFKSAIYWLFEAKKTWGKFERHVLYIKQRCTNK